MGSKRGLLVSIAALGIAAGLVATPQPAWTATDGLPDGSWRQSCEKAYVRDGTLYALCRRDGGKYEFASAPLGTCRAFGNRNGTLFCESADATVASVGDVGQWAGSFQDSCRDATVDKRGKLQATCRMDNGNYKRSNLQAQKCPSYRAGNRNGNLFCESSGTASGTASRWDGSFSNSCREVSMDANGVLTATCQTMSGRWNRSSLSPQQCSSYRAGNRDGTLFCESTDAGSGANRWGGSFSNSCREVSMDSSGILTATCQMASGRWNRSSLSPRQCSSYQAGNRDGTLFCESPDGGGSVAHRWDGSFKNSCRDISIDTNGMLTATCQTASGNWNRSSLRQWNCTSYRAGNRDGTLFCESPNGGSTGAHQWDGSFRNSCRDISIDANGMLTASCQTASGNWNRSSLRQWNCASYRAGNRDGTLFCESGDDGASGTVSRWEGSFGRSCRDISMDSNGMLTATCQTVSGNWNRSSLSPRQCGSYRAANRDGILVCES